VPGDKTSRIIDQFPRNRLSKRRRGKIERKREKERVSYEIGKKSFAAKSPGRREGGVAAG